MSVLNTGNAHAATVIKQWQYMARRGGERKGEREWGGGATFTPSPSSGVAETPREYGRGRECDISADEMCHKSFHSLLHKLLLYFLFLLGTVKHTKNKKNGKVGWQACQCAVCMSSK